MDRGILRRYIEQVSLVVLVSFVGQLVTFGLPMAQAQTPTAQPTPVGPQDPCDAKSSDAKISADALDHCNTKKLMIDTAIVQAGETLAFTTSGVICSVACGAQGSDHTAHGELEGAAKALTAASSDLPTGVTNVGTGATQAQTGATNYATAVGTATTSTANALPATADLTTAGTSLTASATAVTASCADGAGVSAAACCPAAAAFSSAVSAAVTGAAKAAAAAAALSDLNASLTSSAKNLNTGTGDATSTQVKSVAPNAASVEADIAQDNTEATAAAGAPITPPGAPRDVACLSSGSKTVADLEFLEGAATDQLKNSGMVVSYTSDANLTSASYNKNAAEYEIAAKAMVGLAETVQSTAAATCGGQAAVTASGNFSSASATVATSGTTVMANSKSVLAAATAETPQAQYLETSAQWLRTRTQLISKNAVAYRSAAAAAVTARQYREGTAKSCKVAEKVAMVADIAGGVGTAILGLTIMKKLNAAAMVTTVVGSGVQMAMTKGDDVNCIMEPLVQFGQAAVRGVNMAISLNGAAKAGAWQAELAKYQGPSGSTLKANFTSGGGSNSGPGNSGTAGPNSGSNDPTLLRDLPVADQKKFTAKALTSSSAATASGYPAETLPSLLQATTGGGTMDDLNNHLMNGESPMAAAMAVGGATMGNMMPAISALEANKEEMNKELAAIPAIGGATQQYEASTAPRKAVSNGGGGSDLSAMLEALKPPQKTEGPPGSKPVEFAAPSAKGAGNADGLHPANASLFDIVGTRYQLLTKRFLAGEATGMDRAPTPSNDAPSAGVPKNYYLKK